MKNIVLFLLVSILAAISGCAVEKRVAPIQQETIAVPAQISPYNRKDWPHWIDANGDYQNTRQEMLIATSRVPVKFKNARQCTVVSGEWFGVYTGKTFTKASDVDIDHIVPLAHAHRHGAEKWTQDQRRSFASDFENQLVIDDSANNPKTIRYR
ncbi:MAG: DUF1524 domain-containing protein [Nitrosomonas sp.]|nr:DUF1524 domain-containing protein [Nitrosomonas sp.]